KIYADRNDPAHVFSAVVGHRHVELHLSGLSDCGEREQLSAWADTDALTGSEVNSAASFMSRSIAEAISKVHQAKLHGEALCAATRAPSADSMNDGPEGCCARLS